MVGRAGARRGVPARRRLRAGRRSASCSSCDHGPRGRLRGPARGGPARGWGIDAVDREVFGTGDPAEIAAILDRFCRRELGTGSSRALLRRLGGMRRRLAARRRRRRGRQGLPGALAGPLLRAVQAVQAHMAATASRAHDRSAGRRRWCPGARTRRSSSRTARPGAAPVRVGGGAPSVRRRPGPPDRRRPGSCRRAVAPLGDHPLHGSPAASTASRTAPCSTSPPRRRAPGRSTRWPRAPQPGATQTSDRPSSRTPTGRPQRPARRRRSPRRLRLGQRGARPREHGDRAGRGDLVGDGGPRRDGIPNLSRTSSASWATTRQAAGSRLDDVQWRAAAAAAVYSWPTRRAASTPSMPRGWPGDQHAARDRAGEVLAAGGCPARRDGRFRSGPGQRRGSDGRRSEADRREAGASRWAGRPGGPPRRRGGAASGSPR